MSEMFNYAMKQLELILGFFVYEKYSGSQMVLWPKNVP